jgi:hypothetical protein
MEMMDINGKKKMKYAKAMQKYYPAMHMTHTMTHAMTHA